MCIAFSGSDTNATINITSSLTGSTAVVNNNLTLGTVVGTNVTINASTFAGKLSVTAASGTFVRRCAEHLEHYAKRHEVRMDVPESRYQKTLCEHFLRLEHRTPKCWSR